MTPAKKMTRARSALICDQPFFGSLALRLGLVEDNATDTAWTDGVSLGYNPEYVMSLPMGHLVGLVAHEVMHLALLHHTRQGYRDAHKWNIAGDYAINQLLLDSGFELPGGALLSKGFKGQGAEAIYDLMPDISPNPIGEVRPMPGKPTLAQIKLEEQTWKIAVSQAIQQAKAMGKIPGNGFERAVKEALAPKVNWQAALRDFMDQAVKSDYSWMHPNSRYISQGIYLPSLNSKSIGTIVVAIDTSGSVSEKQLEQFAAEVSAMLEEFDTTVTVIYADSKVQGQETFAQADLPLKRELKGGGGTDFRPAFELVEDQGAMPCCLVYLTDMCCTRYPAQAPEYPVLWVNTEDSRCNRDPPFGQVIDMQ